MIRNLMIGLLLLISGILTGFAQDKTWEGPSVDFSHGKLQVSKNNRYLEHKDGTPFLYIGDTAWELFHRLNEQEVDKYLEDRRAKGFTVIQAVILAELDGLKTPNAYGDLPLTDIDKIQPNEKYFKWVDKVIQMAEAKGLYIGLLPTWGDKVDKDFGIGPQIFNPSYISVYGTWLAKRYKEYKNIIWIIGGDSWGGDSNYPTWDALGKSIKKIDKNHLMTFHPSGEHSSSEWFQNCNWLDFNMAQTGHCQRNYEVYQRIIVADYNRTPTKPCMDGEPRYENHPICWKPDSLGWFDDTDVRQALYWDLFSGSCGHTYGCHDIWQMKTPERQAVGLARSDWQSSLSLPGSSQLIFARRLLESLDWNSRVPANDLVVSENTSPEHKIVALKGNGYALVYFPNGEKATFNFKPVGSNENLSLLWMNPRTGETKLSEKIKRNQNQEITPPSSGRGNDWVLIVK